MTIYTLEKRKQRHHSDALCNRYDMRFHKALRKYDESVWEWWILEDNISDKVLLQHREIYWIAFYKNIGVKLYNDTVGGEGVAGYKHSNEAKSKISLANKTRIVSDKTKTKMSLAHKGNTNGKGGKGMLRSNETKSKISAARKGIVFSDETRFRMSIAAKNRKGK